MCNENFIPQHYPLRKSDRQYRHDSELVQARSQEMGYLSIWSLSTILEATLSLECHIFPTNLLRVLPSGTQSSKYFNNQISTLMMWSYEKWAPTSTLLYPSLLIYCPYLINHQNLERFTSKSFPGFIPSYLFSVSFLLLHNKLKCT